MNSTATKLAHARWPVVPIVRVAGETFPSHRSSPRAAPSETRPTSERRPHCVLVLPHPRFASPSRALPALLHARLHGTGSRQRMRRLRSSRRSDAHPQNAGRWRCHLVWLPCLAGRTTLPHRGRTHGRSLPRWRSTPSRPTKRRSTKPGWSPCRYEGFVVVGWRQTRPRPSNQRALRFHLQRFP